MSSYIETSVKCKKGIWVLDKDKKDKYFFNKDQDYTVRVFGNGTSAAVKDETGCLRELYTPKSDKFYKEYFHPLLLLDNTI